jgi:hypothetical protein
MCCCVTKLSRGISGKCDAGGERETRLGQVLREFMVNANVDLDVYR